MEHNQPDLTDLKIFCAVARFSSFSAAANELGITPTYVTKRIAGLEKLLGVLLFRRTTRRVHITDQGELAYTWARRVIDTLNSLTEEVSATTNNLFGPVKISTSLRLGRNHVAPVLSQLKNDFPSLEIWLELVDHRVDLIHEDIDIDIRVGEINEPHLIAHRLTRSNRILCASPKYLAKFGTPTTLAELSRHQCLQFRDRLQAYGVWRFNGPNGLESIKVTGLMGSNQSDIVREWAIDGHGIIMLSEWDIAPNLQDGSMVHLLTDYQQSADVWAVTSARSNQSLKVKTYIDYLTKHLNSGPYALKGA